MTEFPDRDASHNQPEGGATPASGPESGNAATQRLRPSQRQTRPALYQRHGKSGGHDKIEIERTKAVDRGYIRCDAALIGRSLSRAEVMWRSRADGDETDDEDDNQAAWNPDTAVWVKEG